MRQAQRSYWQQQLQEAPPLLELPTDYPRPESSALQGALYSFTLPYSLTQQLRMLSQRTGSTLFMVLLTAFQVQLCRYSGQQDIIVGTPIAGRTQPETEGIVGFFVNTLVLRTTLSGDPSFAKALQRVRDVCLGAYAQQDLPFEQVVELMQRQRDLSYNPLFQVMFSFQHGYMQPIALPDLQLSPLEHGRRTAKFDLTLDLEETPEGIRGRWHAVWMVRR